MFHETVRTPGLAHLSYVLGEGADAAVVDPRRDVDVYLAIARRHGAQIRLVFETHRNEDLVSGARELAAATGARVLHGTRLDFGYGEGVEDGAELELGDLRLRVLHTPGHTDESISIAVHDTGFAPDTAVGVFTGDALFVGDVGRTDFYPDRAEEVAGLLYDSLFEKLLALGDQAIVWPAHGAGSVCGDGMAARELSTIGHERRANPALQLDDREAFVREKLAEEHLQPPYFRLMERWNLAGPPPLPRPPQPAALAPAELAAVLERDEAVVDVRAAEAQAGCSIPGTLGLPLGLLAGYAGWLLDPERPLTLIAEDPDQEREAVRHLTRMGFDRVTGRLAGGVAAWQTQARPLRSVPCVDVHELARRTDAEDLVVLDVRKPAEVRAGHVPGARAIFLGDLPEKQAEVPRDLPVVTFCGSGQRALVAATLLANAGHPRVACCFGSMKAWSAAELPVES